MRKRAIDIKSVRERFVKIGLLDSKNERRYTAMCRRKTDSSTKPQLLDAAELGPFMAREMASDPNLIAIQSYVHAKGGPRRGPSGRLERRRAAVGLGAFFVVVGTLGWNRKSLGAGAPASARGASRRQAPSASPREVGSAKPWQADAAAFPSNLRLSVSYYGAPPSLPLYGIAALAEPFAANALAWDGARAGVAWRVAAGNATVAGAGDGAWVATCFRGGDTFGLEDVDVALDDDRVVAAFCLRAALRRRRATDVSDAGRSRRLCCNCPRGTRSRPCR